jgi:hypothetical protein
MCDEFLQFHSSIPATYFTLSLSRWSCILQVLFKSEEEIEATEKVLWIAPRTLTRKSATAEKHERQTTCRCLTAYTYSERSTDALKNSALFLNSIHDLQTIYLHERKGIQAFLLLSYTFKW